LKSGSEGHPLLICRYERKLRREDWEALKAENPGIKWADLLTQAVTVDTVEGFWRAYLHLKRPTDVPEGVNVYLFRAGQKPAWEEYPEGGCWILKFKHGARGGHSDAGRVWQQLLLALVGEACMDTDVVGACLAVRGKEDMISIWNRDNRDETRRFRIADRVKSILDLDSTSRIEYKFHSRSLVDKSTYANAQGFVFLGDGGRGGRGRGGSGPRRGGGGGRGGGSTGGGGTGAVRSWRTSAAGESDASKAGRGKRRPNNKGGRKDKVDEAEAE
jgi:translation initiation factor 4E